MKCREIGFLSSNNHLQTVYLNRHKMKILAQNSSWSILINILLQKYFSDLTTTCIMWPENFDFNLLPATSNSMGNSAVFINFKKSNLAASFANNVYNFTERQAKDQSNDVFYNDLVKKLVVAIEFSHCEGFVAFQDDIPLFAEAFQLASIYSIWRSIQNRFLFAYYKDCNNQEQQYFQHKLFKDQANILIVEAEDYHSSVFRLKTNKFVGSYWASPNSLISLSTFYASNNTFVPDIDLFSPHKLKNLQGREIIIAAFDYRPFVAVDFQFGQQYYDHAEDNPSHQVHVDGTEIRICHTFCEIYNCTVQFDTSEKEEWGNAYANYTGYGLLGMIMDGRANMATGAMYTWDSFYRAVDLTTFLGRSGVTCLVPAPKRLTSWSLPLRPFELTLWLAVLVGMILEALALFIARKFDQFLSRDIKNWWQCIQFGCVTAFKIFVSQGSDDTVSSHTVRTILFACYMVDIIITSVYGGGLAAILTTPSLSEAADSVERLNKFNISWTATAYSWVESMIDDKPSSIYNQLRRKYVVNSFDEMRRKAKTEDMGFVLERMAFGHFGNGDFITPEALARLKLMVEDIYSSFTVAMVPRLWAHLPQYNNLIMAWHSSGFDKFWEWKITADYLNVNEQNQVQDSMYMHSDNGAVKLNMKNFGGLILIWLVGIIISIMAFIAELMWFKMCGNRNKRN